MIERQFGMGIWALLGISLLSIPTANAHQAGKSISAPREVHEYQQVRFLDEDYWTCRRDCGCMICTNETEAALIAEVTATYKGEGRNIHTDTQEVRQHCVYPEQHFWACLQTNVVIEPKPGTRPDAEGDASSCPPL